MVLLEKENGRYVCLFLFWLLLLLLLSDGRLW